MNLQDGFAIDPVVKNVNVLMKIHKTAERTTGITLLNSMRKKATNVDECMHRIRYKTYMHYAIMVE